MRDGAHVNLARPQFKRTDDDLLHVFAHGAGTHVSVQGGTMTGGSRGAVVCAGARLHATDLTVTGVHEVSVEVRGSGPHVDLTDCKLADHPQEYSCGMQVHRGSAASLTRVSISAMDGGVFVTDEGTIATLYDCNIDCTYEGCCV